MPSPPKKIKNPRNSRVFPDFNGFFRILPHVCCIFTPSAPCFAVFLRCFCLVHCCLFFLFALFCFSFSVFHGFSTVFGSFFPSFLALFSSFKVSAAPCARFFGVWFSFFRFSFDFFVILMPFLPSAVPHPSNKSTFFVRFFAFFFCFFLARSSFAAFFYFFSCFFPAIVGICGGKSKIRRFRLSNGKKIVRTVQTTAQEGKNRRCRKEKRRQKGKSALRADTISQKQAFFSLIT